MHRAPGAVEGASDLLFAHTAEDAALEDANEARLRSLELRQRPVEVENPLGLDLFAQVGIGVGFAGEALCEVCLLYTSPSPRD